MEENSNFIHIQKTMSVHQCVKYIHLFVTELAEHKLSNQILLIDLCFNFIAFSLLSQCMYFKIVVYNY